MPRKRINRRKIVYSTNPKIHDTLCQLQDKRNQLNKPVLVSNNIGKSYEQVIVCRTVIKAERTIITTGRFLGTRNFKRKKLHS